MPSSLRRRGRASGINPPNRFERLHLEEDPAALDEEERRQVPTQLFYDNTKQVLSRNDSPDIPFTYSLNPYRGCEHGCAYCYARPYHEYLGFSAGLDFETKILVKAEAPRLLAQAFRKKTWVPQVVSLSGATDPYQPLERRLELSRKCLEVFRRFRNPVSVVTKNYLVTRDLDLLEALAERNLVHVSLSITTLKPEIAGVMEPRTSRPGRRLAAVEALAKRGIPVGVNIAPVVPGLTDEEIPSILEAVAERGGRYAGFLMLRLPGAVRPVFIDWLEAAFPDRAARVLRRQEELRGPSLDDARFGIRMKGEGEWAGVVKRLFEMNCRRLGLNRDLRVLRTDQFRRVTPGQGELF